MVGNLAPKQIEASSFSFYIIAERFIPSDIFELCTKKVCNHKKYKDPYLMSNLEWTEQRTQHCTALHLKFDEKYNG